MDEIKQLKDMIKGTNAFMYLFLATKVYGGLAKWMFGLIGIVMYISLIIEAVREARKDFTPEDWEIKED